MLISRDDNSKKYTVTFQLPAYNYLALREYPVEAIVLTIDREEEGEIPDGEYVLIQEGRKFLLARAEAGEQLEAGFPYSLTLGTQSRLCGR